MTRPGRATVALMLVAATLTAGCARGAAGASEAGRTTSAGAEGSTTGADAPYRTSGQGTVAALGQQHGFALPSWNTGDYDDPQSSAYLRAIAAAGARWVQLTPTWYQRTSRDDVMRPTDQTASDDSLRHIIRKARAIGLKIMVKPHVDLPGDQDRATIRPLHPARWFAAYTGFVRHYAQLAAGERADEFAVGTELAGVSPDRARWEGVIRAVRAQFRGPLVYAANYDEYRKVGFWDLLDLIGVDAYWPLADRPTTDPAALARAWRPIAAQLAAFAARAHRKVLFTEAGYVSQRGCTTQPYSWTISKVPANAEQAAAYQALLASFSKQGWWDGVFWWMWDDWPGSGETPAKLAYTPHGKPAETVVRHWWTHP